MKKKIREKRTELLKKSSVLQELALDEKGGFKVREEQKKAYAKWLFYDRLIKACEKK